MSEVEELIIPDGLKRRTTGHGYDAECECDLEGGDPDCKIQPPYESMRDWLVRIFQHIAKLEAQVQWVKITDENMPKMGDEWLGENPIAPNPFHVAIGPVTDWHVRNLRTAAGWGAHSIFFFRKIGAPEASIAECEVKP